MTAVDLYRSGRLDEAIQALGTALRDNPADTQRRTFLFELLAFAGDYDRAEKQLDILSDAGKEAELGVLVLRGALYAERHRQEMFASGRFPESGITPKAPSGTINGKPFNTLADADPRIGARLEVLAAGQYMWLPLEHVQSISAEAPKRLRDLLWIPAMVRVGPALRDLDLGEVLIPVITPLASAHPDGSVRLGQMTEWQELEDGREAPVGQKLFLVDDEEFPILELRELEIAPLADTAEPAPHAVAR
jgi:type VI secretion system protein ImpE